MNTYVANKLVEDIDGQTVIEIGFGTPADNDEIVPDAIKAIEGLGLKGGRLICINGPASMPVAMTIAHAVAHIYSYVACFDPKLNRYVVVIAHGPDQQPGDLLAA